MVHRHPMSDDDAALTDDEYASLGEFRYALRLFLAFSDEAARDAGLTPAHHQLLLAIRSIEATGHPPTIGELAEQLQLKPHSTAELVDRACDKDLVTRSGDPADGRRSLLRTTELGRRTLEQLSRIHRRELVEFRVRMADLLDRLDG